MRCSQCNEEMEQASTVCSRCGHEAAEVKVLRPDERDGFQGLTIQQGEDPSPGSGSQTGSSGNYEYRSENAGQRVYVRQVSFGSGSSGAFGFLSKLIVLAVILFLVFVALPVALVLMAAFSLVWWLLRR